MAHQLIDLNKVVADLNRRVELTVATIAVEVTAELRETTPVDTGFARASWVPSIGAPSPELGGMPEAPSPAAADAGLARVAAFKLSDGRAFITNNTRYIRNLARGSSSQAPAGFDLQAIHRGLRSATQILDSSGTLQGLRARVLARGAA